MEKINETWWLLLRKKDGTFEDPRAVPVHSFRAAYKSEPAEVGITLRDGRKTRTYQEADHWIYCRTEAEAMAIKQKHEQMDRAYATDKDVVRLRERRKEILRLQIEMYDLLKVSGDEAVSLLVPLVKDFCEETGRFGFRMLTCRYEDGRTEFTTEYQSEPRGVWEWFGQGLLTQMATFRLRRFIKDHTDDLIATTDLLGGEITFTITPAGVIVENKKDKTN